MKSYFFLFVLLFSQIAFAQNAFELDIKIQDDDSISLQKEINYTKTFSSLGTRNKAIKDALNQFYRLGYLSATIDSIFEDSLKWQVQLQVGQLFKWLHLEQGNVNEVILSQIGYRENYLQKNLFIS